MKLNQLLTLVTEELLNKDLKLSQTIENTFQSVENESSPIDLSKSLSEKKNHPIQSSFYFSFIKEPSKELFDLVNEAYMVENFFKATTRFIEIKELEEMFKQGDFLGCFANAQDLSMKNCLGCVYIEGKNINKNSSENEVNAVYFGSLAVKPNLQGLGIGSKLVSKVELIAKTLSISNVELYAVNIRKDLIQFYQRKGYSIFGFEEWPLDYLFTVKEESKGLVGFTVLRKSISI